MEFVATAEAPEVTLHAILSAFPSTSPEHRKAQQELARLDAYRILANHKEALDWLAKHPF